jgi:hypothetical protein
MASRAWWAERFGRNPKLTGGEVGLEDRLEDDLGRRHDHTVSHRRDAERPGRPRLVRLGDVDPAQRSRAVRLVPQLLAEPVEERPHSHDATVGDRRDTHAVDAGSALVLGHLGPCPPQDVAAGDLVVEGVEAPVGLLLGAAIQHALKARTLSTLSDSLTDLADCSALIRVLLPLRDAPVK